ncbi:hypothetical protein PQX77_010769 [Marasmius sp. AFHP31]|nr:hypothetical protein PQX77_010769 [Marasmius sp. AFHP31]
MTAIIAILVQGFFAWRIQVLTGNKWFVGTVLATSLAGFRMCPPVLRADLKLNQIPYPVGGVITSVEVGRTPEFVNFRDFKVLYSPHAPSPPTDAIV